MLVERHGHVGVLTLNRPSRLNALDPAAFATLDAELAALASAPWCRVVVLAGAGRSFCAGLDISGDLDRGEPGSVQRFYALMRRATALMVRMREMPQPVVAAVQGHAVGVGFALAAGADMRMVAPDACFKASFVSVGMTPGDIGLSWFLPRLIGPQAAAEIFYSGGDLLAERACELGLASELIADPRAGAIEWAEKVAEQAPMAVRLTKELLASSLGMTGLREHLELELRSQVICAFTDDHAEARTAFSERRKPVFEDV